MTIQDVQDEVVKKLLETEDLQIRNSA